MKTGNGKNRLAALLLALAMTLTALPAFAEESAPLPEMPAETEIQEQPEAAEQWEQAALVPAAAPESEPVTVSVTGGSILRAVLQGAELPVADSTCMEVPKGTFVTVEPTDPAQFACWVNEFDAKLSAKATYTFSAERSTAIRACSRSESGLTVQYLPDAGHIYKVETVTAAEEISLPPLGYFVRPGYTPCGWSVQGGETMEPDAAREAIAACIGRELTVAVCPVFARDTDTVVTVTVSNTDAEITGGGEYRLNDVVTLEAPAKNGAGEDFSCWTDGENILSYAPVYRFYAARSLTLTAVYGTEYAAEAIVGVTAIDNHNGTVTFVSEATIPEGGSILRAGLLVTTEEALRENMTPENSLVRTGTPKNDDTTAYRYTYTVKASATVFAAGYLEYRDAEGETRTVTTAAKALTPAEAYVQGKMETLSGRLPDVVAQAEAGDVIVLCGDSTLEEKLVLEKNLTFTDDGAPHTVSSAFTADYAISVEAGKTAFAATRPGYLRFVPAKESPAREKAFLYVKSKAELDITNAVLDGFTSGAVNGSALYVGQGSVMVLNHVTVKNCSGSGTTGGGALYNYRGTLQMTDCTFTGNRAAAKNGGAVYLNSSDTAVGRLTAENCVFTGNSAEANGGAFYMNGDSEAVFTGCTFRDNRAGNAGQAIYSYGGVLTLTDTYARAQTETGRAIYTADGSVTTIGGRDNITIRIPAGQPLILGSALADDAVLGIYLGKENFTPENALLTAGKGVDADALGRAMTAVTLLDSTDTTLYPGRDGVLHAAEGSEATALLNVAAAYYRNRDSIDYDQNSFATPEYNSIRNWRRNMFVTAQDAAPDRVIFLDCSSFVWNTYYDTFVETSLPAAQRESDPAYQAFAEKFLTARLANTESMSNESLVESILVKKYDMTKNAWNDVQQEVMTLLQPGDLLVRRDNTNKHGHVLLWTGTGYIHCTGTSFSYSEPVKEALQYGRILSDATLDKFLESSLYTFDTVMILRPLQTLRGTALSPEAYTRLLLGNMGVTKTASAAGRALCPGQSVCPEDEVTYTVTVDNTDNTIMNKRGIPNLPGIATVTDAIPVGTVFLRGDEGAVYDPAAGTVTWERAAIEKGEKRTFSYTVRVDALQAGDTLTGTAARISAAGSPQYAILAPLPDTTVESTDLADAQQRFAAKVEAALAKGTTGGLQGAAWLNGLRTEVLGSGLGTTGDAALLDAFTVATGANFKLNNMQLNGANVSRWLVANFRGGRKVNNRSYGEAITRCRLVQLRNLQVGDVIAVRNILTGTDKDSYTYSYHYYIYLGGTRMADLHGSVLSEVSVDAAAVAAGTDVISLLPAQTNFAVLRLMRA